MEVSYMPDEQSQPKTILQLSEDQAQALVEYTLRDAESLTKVAWRQWLLLPAETRAQQVRNILSENRDLFQQVCVRARRAGVLA
jgi:hypothetical protein